MAEYKEDKLADGSDDEKRLYEAELRTGRKRRKSLNKKESLASLIGKIRGLGGSPETYLVVICQHRSRSPLWDQSLVWLVRSHGPHGPML